MGIKIQYISQYVSMENYYRHDTEQPNFIEGVYHSLLSCACVIKLFFFALPLLFFVSAIYTSIDCKRFKCKWKWVMIKSPLRIDIDKRTHTRAHTHIYEYAQLFTCNTCINWLMILSYRRAFARSLAHTTQQIAMMMIHVMGFHHDMYDACLFFFDMSSIFLRKFDFLTICLLQSLSVAVSTLMISNLIDEPIVVYIMPLLKVIN